MSDIQKAIDKFNHKNFKAQYAANAAQARDMVLAIIGKTDTVGAGGSMTLEEAGIIEALLERGNTVISSTLAKKAGSDPTQARKDGMTADVYLTSSNAVTLQGDLINIDGVGNRAAAMFYGPDKVVVVAGKNKLTDNPMTAVTRIKKEACPPNAQRLSRDTPCARTGKCGECEGPDRMCNVVVRIQYPTTGKEIHVILIDEDYGY